MLKRKIKQKKKQKKVIVAFFISLLIITSGYAIFSETLRVVGTARTSDYHTNNILHAQLILNASNRYTTGGTTRITFQNETYDGFNNLSAYFSKNDTTTTARSNTFTINFTNPYRAQLTSVSVARVVVSGTFASSSVTVSRTSITYNQAANIRLSTSHRNSTVGSGQIRVTLQGRLNGVTKYFYYTVYIS